jgi:hypothetical protein
MMRPGLKGAKTVELLFFTYSPVVRGSTEPGGRQTKLHQKPYRYLGGDGTSKRIRYPFCPA